MKTSQVYKALKFWVVQNLVEILVILLLGYLGVDVMGDFCVKCLFIENVEATAWGISIKALIFLLPYILLFLILHFTRYFNGSQNSLKNAFLNLIVSLAIVIVLGFLKPKDIKEVFLPLVASLISSLIIIIYTKYRSRSVDSRLIK